MNKEMNKMSLNEKSIKQVLNPVFLKQKPESIEIELFKKEFNSLLSKINEYESEAYNKKLISDFLENVYYREKYEINEYNDTKNKIRVDFAIKRKDKPSVEVLFEVKHPTNKTEMISRDNLNKKALQELLLYYMSERINNNNQFLRYFIVTNMYEWFVFDAKDFYELFYENKSFKDKFNQYNNNQLEGDKTKYFYEQIAAPEIEKLKDKIKFTYLNIKNYENTNDNELIELYKFLSPVHLLKLSFANDANELNKEFYVELLYILGLEEIKQGNKKLIVRKKKDDRDNGSIIENAIENIDSGDKLYNLNNEQYGNTKDEQLFNVALDLAITWINRILFLKLLESQIVKYNQNNENFAFLSVEQLEGFNELNGLFFSVVARKADERTDYLRNKFSHIPYLNSSLFEITDMENKTICIDSLHDNIKIKLYSQSVLKNKKGANISNTMRPLEYLLRFLDAYDFGSEGLENIQKENKPLISASVLGLIFEKINGYKDGSFFTPSFITMYMCHETISQAIIQKFNETKNWNCQTIIELHNKIDNIKEANKIFNSVRICDPAVGSGHFLVSALNEMIALKSELGILADETGKKLKVYITIERDELNIKDENGDIFQYNSRNHESQRVQETFFHEKQTLIENCLFGVDINPNSVKICQLRLWIELLKHTYYKQNTIELETLPNIDINIKCGNSLLSRFDLHDKYHDNPALQQKIRQTTQNYKMQVALYKNVHDKAAKQQIEKQIETEKSFFYQINNAKDSDYQNLLKAQNELTFHTSSFNFFETKVDEFDNKTAELTRKEQEMKKQYNSKISSCFEWRFEFPEVLDDDGNFVGFDVVIGNPPYGIFNKKQNKKVALNTEDYILEQIKRKYPEATGGMVNAARMFLAFSYSISRKKYFQCMIVPYGILTDTTSANLRKHIFANHTLLKVDVFPERDNTKCRVFDEVKMSTAILLTKKNKTDEKFDLGISYDRTINQNRSIFNPKDLLDFNPDLVQIPLTNTHSFNLLLKIYKKSDYKLDEISPCLTGEIDMTLGKSTLSTNQTNSMLVKGVQIDRFILKTEQIEISQGMIEYVDLEKTKKVISNKKLSDVAQKRIALQGLTGVNEKRRLKATIIDKNTFLANSCNYILETEKIKLEYILALFNSSLMNFVFKTLSTNSNVNGYEVDNLPIKIAENQQPIIDLVDEILRLKNCDTDTSALECEIDKLVYGLYGLTEEEIKIVETLPACPV